MKKLYQKNELTFSLIWIGIYVVGTMLSDGLSEFLGVKKLITMIFTGAISFFLLLWPRKEKLLEKFGLCPVQGAPGEYLWYIPLAVTASVNLWYGVTLNDSIHETVFYVISMIFVGFLEELIFRGFLFRALEKDSFVQAVVISSVTFGFGHIVNLLSGSDLIPTLLQIAYATAAGFCFTALFVRTKSLWPCVITHAAINALSAFRVDSGTGYITSIVLLLVNGIYGWWLMRGYWNVPKQNSDNP